MTNNENKDEVLNVAAGGSEEKAVKINDDNKQCDKETGENKSAEAVDVKKMKKKFRSSIGGQAVLEGVMMRGEKSMATCVREPDGKLSVETVRLKSVKDKSIVYRIPFVRGIFNFGESMVGGVKTLMRSAAVYAGEEEATKTETWLAKKFKINIMDVVMVISVILGLVLSIGLFFFLPLGITEAIKLLDKNGVVSGVVWNLIDGIVRMLIFIAYVGLTSLVKDVRRTFMYHGAEHKTISCYEYGLDLTVENVQKMSTVHDRCGTTFMFIVMVISIAVFSLTGWEGDSTIGGFFLRFLIRLALLPVVAGVSYEILKFLAKFDNAFVRALKAPGLLLQKLTTKQPTDDMVECAICAFKTVLEMDKDESIEEKKFDVKLLYKKSREELEEMLKNDEDREADLDWMFVEVLKVKRSELSNITHIRQSEFDRVKNMAKLRSKGIPLQHILGNTVFYGYTIKTDGRALIPRPETEYLVEAVVKEIKENGYQKGIDMCSGTGAIAIAIEKEAPSVTSIIAADISKYALELARENSELNGCSKIELCESDLFGNIDGKYDFIVSNPPYIKSADIDILADEVKTFEPRLALDGGEDGYDYYRKIAESASNYLNPKGLIALEVGIGQSETVKSMLENNFDNIRIVKDLEGIDRIVLANLKE